MNSSCEILYLLRLWYKLDTINVSYLAIPAEFNRNNNVMPHVKAASACASLWLRNSDEILSTEIHFEKKRVGTYKCNWQKQNAQIKVSEPLADPGIPVFDML